MKTWKAVLIFVCIFIAGAVTGGFVGIRCAVSHGWRHSGFPGQNPPHRPIDDWSKRQKREFITRLSITDEQQAKIEPLFRAALSEFRQLRENAFHQAVEVTDRLDAQLMLLLTPEQKVKFGELIKERKERQKKAEAERFHGDHSPKPGGNMPPPPADGKLPPPPPASGDQLPPSPPQVH